MAWSKAEEEFSADPGVDAGFSTNKGVVPDVSTGWTIGIGKPGGMSIGAIDETIGFAAISAAIFAWSSANSAGIFHVDSFVFILW